MTLQGPLPRLRQFFFSVTPGQLPQEHLGNLFPMFAQFQDSVSCPKTLIANNFGAPAWS